MRTLLSALLACCSLSPALALGATTTGLMAGTTAGPITGAVAGTAAGPAAGPAVGTATAPTVGTTAGPATGPTAKAATESTAEPATEPAAAYRFVIIPKVVHPWFDLVHDGAKQAARMIKQQTGRPVTLDYRPPQKAEVAEQSRLLEQAMASNPDGIAMDLLDDQAEQASLAQARRQGIPLVLFDSEPPAGMDLPYVGNDFCEQARLAAARLVTLLGGEGEVAIMRGVPTAVNHRIRAECHERLFQEHPGIKLVAKGIDHDDIATAREQAKAIMAEHPRLRGWVSSDAGGVIGIAQAIKEANLTGQVFNVGLDDLPETIQLIREGAVDSSYATKPHTQGYWSIISLWQARLGAPMPKDIDTGIGIVTRDNADQYQGR